MNHLSRNDGPSLPPEEAHEEHDNFDDSNYGLWSLYEKAVQSRDKVRIEALKDDMDGVLIFVCTHYLPLVASWFYFLLISGWFILRCHHRIHSPQDPGFESKPRGPISFLSTTNRSDSRSNITTTRVSWRPDLNQSHPPTALSYLSVIIH